MKRDPFVHYDLKQVNSTIIADVTGNGFAGVIRNYDSGGALLHQEAIYENIVPVVTLPGGKDGGYIDLPNGFLRSDDGLTISCWCNLLSIKDQQCVWSLGNDTCLYLYVSPGENGYYCLPSVTKSGRSQEKTIYNDRLFSLDQWYLFTVLLDQQDDNTTLSFYVDGQLLADIKEKQVNAKALTGAPSCSIGFGTFFPAPTHMKLADFRIYSFLLTPSEISSLFCVTDQGRVLADLRLLTIPAHIDYKLPPDFIPDANEALPASYQALFLSSTGVFGSTITWTSSHSHILKDDGTVIHPLPRTVPVCVQLTADVNYHEAFVSHPFTIEIDSIPSDKEVLEHDLTILENNFPTILYKDLSLPEKGAFGSMLTWKSSRPEYLTSEGKISRPDKAFSPQEVQLQIKATRYDEILIHNLLVYVLPSIDPACIEDPSRSACSWKYSDTPVSEQKNSSKDSMLVPLGTYPLLSDLRLKKNSIFYDNQKRLHQYLRILSPDRMLYNFRNTYHTSTHNALPLGGWEEPSGLLRGHCTGHYLSGLALAYASSADESLCMTINIIAQELRNLQLQAEGDPDKFITLCNPNNAAQSLWNTTPDTWGNGYLGAYSPDQFALLEQYTTYATIWAPYYTLHKILAGLLDCYQYAKNSLCLTIAEDIGLWINKRLNACSPKQRSKMWSMYIAGEYGGINESLSQLSILTGKRIFLETAMMFDNPYFFNGLAIGHDTIRGLHANQHIPQIIGALIEYKASGNKYYYDTARNFWNIVTSHYVYSIGGVGRGEVFKEPDVLAANIETDRNCETCASYNMLKLTEELYAYQPDYAAFMDYYERTMINHIAASQNPVVTSDCHNGVTYMLPVGPGQHKEYSDDYNDFTCCHGTGMENHSKYMKTAYFLSNDQNTLYCNLYQPSSFYWRERDITITQKQSFPSERIRIIISGEGSFECKLRIPGWAYKDAEIRVNDECIAKGNELAASSYYSIRRDWKDGDCIDFYTPFTIYLDKTQDSPDGEQYASVLYGPFVMAALCNETEYKTLVLSADLNWDFKVSWDEVSGLPSLHYPDLTFVPLFMAHHDAYHVYFKVLQP